MLVITAYISANAIVISYSIYKCDVLKLKSVNSLILSLHACVRTYVYVYVHFCDYVFSMFFRYRRGYTLFCHI